MKHFASTAAPENVDNSDPAQGIRGAPAQAGTIDILYFARLKEALGLRSERMVLPQTIDTAGALRAHLQARGGAWAVELAAENPVRVAVNQVMASADARIHPGDEVAFLPPVTGG
jgi:molybdopterin synthase sulfur carrier subunit